MRSYAVRVVSIAVALACFAFVFLGLAWASSSERVPKTCRVSETMPAEDGGPDWTRWVVVPCDPKPPSSARVETGLNPNPVDVDREAVDGGQGGRW